MRGFRLSVAAMQWRNRVPCCFFSEQVEGKGVVPKVYEDWEYCQMITHELKANNINPALSLLFQSYLNNRILDIQIYNQIYEKITANSLSLSYAEILYTIYREHFPPHLLISNWMNKLTTSKCEEFLGKLRKDYEILGQPYPQKPIRSVKREARKESKVEKEDVSEDVVTTSRAGRLKKTFNKSIESVELPNIDPPKPQEEMTPQQLIRMKISSEVKEIMSQLSLDISSFTRVVVHNLEVEFQNDMGENDEDELPYDEQYQYGEEDMQPLGLYGLDISKIKIGRIEFFNDKKEQ